MPAKQLYLDGTAPPNDPNIETALDGWLEAKHEQKNASETAKTRHATLLLHMQNAGVEAYPYVDPSTGKKKQVVVAKEPKAKLVNAPKWNRRDRDSDVGEEVETPEADDRVETRRVKRSQVKNADAIVDPFASTRSGMGLIAEAERAQDAANVVETAEGDVVPSDKAAPKKARGKKAKKS